MIPDKDKKYERPEAYPKPTETDTQLNQQAEFTEPSPNRASDQDSQGEELKQAQERMRRGGNAPIP